MTGPTPVRDGLMPTPYGSQIKMFRRPELSPDDDAAWVLDVEGTALLAGIYDPVERKRFADETARQTERGSGAVRLRFEDFGGHPVPKVPLPQPSLPTYPRLPGDDSTPVEAWITGLLDRFRWCERAEFLVDIIGGNLGNLDQARAADLREEAIFCLGLSVILTGALEHVPEPEIDCIEAAAFYALTDHREWRAAGLQWLTPFRETWFADWRDARPAYARFAGLMALGHDLPAWLGDGDSRRPGA